MGEKETLSTGERSQPGGGAIAIDEEGVQRASNLNLSKSNIDRLAGGEPDPEPAGTVKSSKSNSSERRGDPGPGVPGGAAEASNLNSSKSNTYRAAGPSEGVAVDEPGVVDN